jgi:hypothetical protein
MMLNRRAYIQAIWNGLVIRYEMRLSSLDEVFDLREAKLGSWFTLLCGDFGCGLGLHILLIFLRCDMYPRFPDIVNIDYIYGSFDSPFKEEQLGLKRQWILVGLILAGL